MATSSLPPTPGAAEEEAPQTQPPTSDDVSGNPDRWNQQGNPEESGSGVVDARSRFPRAAASGAPQPLRLVLQGSASMPPDILPLRLARRLGLDVWGDFLLGRRVAHEMGAAAIVLLVVLVFELLAWTLLFNVLVHSAQWELSWRTSLAFTLAAVFAGGVFLFERSFVTADFRESPLRKSAAYVLRLGIILGSCLVTSQPLELLVFGGAIETRLRDENALAEAVRLVQERERYEEASRGKSRSDIETELGGTTSAKERESARQRRDDLRSTIRQLEEDLSRAQRAETSWEGEVRRRSSRVNDLASQVRRQSDPVRRQDLQRSLDRARNWYSAGQRDLESARQKRAAVAGDLGRARGDLTGATEDFQSADSTFRGEVEKEVGRQNTQVEKAKSDLKGLQDWFRIVQNAPPGQRVPRKTGGFLEPKAADLTERLRVLEDLKEATPAAWPSASDKFISEAVTLFGLEPPGGTKNATIKERRRLQGKLFSRTYWIAFVIAGVIPLLTLAFKLMMSQELMSYYSAESQARAGNPEAIRALYARGVHLEDLDRTPPPQGPQSRPRRWFFWRRGE